LGDKYVLIEIEIGGDDLINDRTAAIKTLADKIDNTRMKSPSFLIVRKYVFKRQHSLVTPPRRKPPAKKQ